MNEEWRPIEGYEGLYEVSNTGQVRSLDRYDSRNCFRKGKVLIPGKNKDGYLQVNLSYNGKLYKKYVHRLVAQAFIPNPDNLPQVNHKNEDKTNNRVENLEMCDAKYNSNYGTRNDRIRDTSIKNGYWTGLSIKENKKNYYQKNRDRICDSRRSYYQKNKDRICDRVKEYSQKNKEKIREYHHQYYLKKKKEIQNNVKSLDDQD